MVLFKVIRGSHVLTLILFLHSGLSLPPVLGVDVAGVKVDVPEKTSETSGNATSGSPTTPAPMVATKAMGRGFGRMRPKDASSVGGDSTAPSVIAPSNGELVTQVPKTIQQGRGFGRRKGRPKEAESDGESSSATESTPNAEGGQPQTGGMENSGAPSPSVTDVPPDEQSQGDQGEEEQQNPNQKKRKKKKGKLYMKQGENFRKESAYEEGSSKSEVIPNEEGEKATNGDGNEPSSPEGEGGTPPEEIGPDGGNPEPEDITGATPSPDQIQAGQEQTTMNPESETSPSSSSKKHKVVHKKTAHGKPGQTPQTITVNTAQTVNGAGKGKNKTPNSNQMTKTMVVNKNNPIINIYIPANPYAIRRKGKKGYKLHGGKRYKKITLKDGTTLVSKEDVEELADKANQKAKSKKKKKAKQVVTEEDEENEDDEERSEEEEESESEEPVRRKSKSRKGSRRKSKINSPGFTLSSTEDKSSVDVKGSDLKSKFLESMKKPDSPSSLDDSTGLGNSMGEMGGDLEQSHASKNSKTSAKTEMITNDAMKSLRGESSSKSRASQSETGKEDVVEEDEKEDSFAKIAKRKHKNKGTALNENVTPTSLV